jgi:hypothetical protein
MGLQCGVVREQEMKRRGMEKGGFFFNSTPVFLSFVLRQNERNKEKLKSVESRLAARHAGHLRSLAGTNRNSSRPVKSSF